MWGIARYVALGGDPANFYANYQKIDVKITFFDINDGLIATVAAFILAWRLLHGAATDSFRRRAFYVFFLLVELFIVVFSFRRSGWLGFGLAAVLFAFAQKTSVRNLLFVVYAATGVPLIVYQAFKRMAGSSLMAGAGFLEKLAPDIFASGKVTTDSGRFVELSAAWRSISDSPIFGLGVWGEYRGFGIPDLAFHRGDFSWMHSGVLHIWLKAGFLGVALLLGMWFFYAKFLAQHASRASTPYRGLMLAAAAGFLFMLPTWLVGTPVIEYRTMQLAALFFALPYAVYAIDQRRRLAA
jgi:O-antigen ligase